MTDDNDAIVNRLFDITERYECLLRAVKKHPDSVAIQLLAETIETERGNLREGEG